MRLKIGDRVATNILFAIAGGSRIEKGSIGTVVKVGNDYSDPKEAWANVQFDHGPLDEAKRYQWAYDVIGHKDYNTEILNSAADLYDEALMAEDILKDL